MRNLLLLILIIVTISCGRGDQNNESSHIMSSADENLYAKLFSFSQESNYTVLTIKSPWQGDTQKVLKYYIANTIDSLPLDIPSGSVIKTPISRVVCLSTTHLAMIGILGETESIAGLSGIDYVTNSKVRRRIENGEIKEIGYDSNINNELIVTIKPDLVIAHGIGPETASYMAKLEEAGIPVLFISDYLETDPLARVEWIKVFGKLYKKEFEADSYFDFVAGEYEVLSYEVAKRVLPKPLVMTGLPYKDTWFVSPGNSFMSKIISDAGGKYIWEELSSNRSMPMSLESVYLKSLNADIWINVGNAQSISELISLDARLSDLPPVKNSLVFNNINRLGDHGGNDYWESGAVMPHIILRDIVSIFHPELLPGYDPCYYLRLK
jgi:iron complex transport system substrate-binding protein